MEFNKKTTIKILKALAKERGLKRYSQLKKAELIRLLLPINIMDEPAPNIGQAPLIPIPVKKLCEKYIHKLRVI